MRTIGMLILLGLSACSGNGHEDRGPGVTGSGSGTSRTYAITDFDGVVLEGGDDIDVRVGSGFSVRAEGAADQLDRLRIAKEGGKLDVGRRGGMSWGRQDAVKIFVTMPRIAAATIAGAGNMSVDRAEGADFAGTISGSGDLDIAALAVDRARLSIAGSGNLKAAGTAGTLGIEIAGSGDVAAPGLVAQRGEVSISGAGNVHARVNGPAKVSILGAGNVDLGPTAKCSVSKMGVGEVTCGS